jgi:formylglycine-generating enzyme required for sulfatase activity
MKMVWCPPGQFTMGRAMQGFETPFVEFQAPVTLTTGFWIGKYEVTQSQWEQVMMTKPWSGKPLVESIGGAKEGPDYPAVWMTWEEASQFCNRFTEAERRAERIDDDNLYVLPTEAQWEYACRAGTTTQFSFGDDIGELSDYAWWGAVFRGNATGEPYAHRVGTKLPNPWGLHDMHGNVHEMCSDLYEDKVSGGVDPTGAKSGTRRVIRGGSWNDNAENCRTTLRREWPLFNTPFLIWHELGFRIVRVSVGKT